MILLLGGCSNRNAGNLRPSDDYYGKFPGQWTSSHWAGGDRWEKYWALSFGKNYSVFIKTPEGRLFRGVVDMRLDLGIASDGRIRTPPGSTPLDVRIDVGPDPGHKGEYLLGAFSKVSARRNMHGEVLNGCLGEPGGRVRASSFEEPVEGVRCFQLFKAGDDVATEIELMAGQRARDGRWHVSKSSSRDVGAHLHAHVQNMSNFMGSYALVIFALLVVARIHRKIGLRELTGPTPMAVIVFPYVGPRTRAALWRAMLFFMLLLILPVPLFLSPGIVLVVIVAHMMTRLAGKLGLAERSGDEISLIQKLRGLALVTAVGVGLLVPLYLIYFLAYYALGQPPGGALYDLVATPYARSVNRWVALAGVGVVTLFIVVDAFWRLRMAATVSNLATSTAASVSHGLVELAGYAQPVRGVPGDEPNLLRCTQTTMVEIDWRIVPFDLEDASGRIRIDPRGAKFNPGWIGDLLHVFVGFHEIALNGRVIEDDEQDSVTRTLEAGDPVYVIGHARLQRDEATGEEMHVVSPFETAFESPFRRLFGGAQSAQNIFFLSDSGEEEAKEHLLRGFRRVWFVCIAWLAASTFLYWSAS